MKRKLSLISILLALFILFPTIIGHLGSQEPYAIPIANMIGNSGFGVCSQADTNKGIATLNYDTGNSGGGDVPDVGDAATGGTSAATGKIISYTISGGTFAGGDAAGALTLGAVTGCFQDNEVINFTDGETAAVNGDTGVGIANDPMDNDSTGSWTDDGANIALAFAAAEYTVTTNAADQRAWMTNLAFTAGFLYKIEIDIKDGTQAGVVIETYFDDGAAQYGKEETTAAGWASIWMTFECATTTATGLAGFRIEDNCGGNNIEIRRFSVYEVRPPFTAADDKCFDLWVKDTTCDVYKYWWDGGTNSQEGSYFTCMMVPSVASDFIRFPGDNYDNIEWYVQQRGRTITIGKWILTNTANHAKLTITDSAGSTDSSFHTGGGAFEWLEVTRTINAVATSVAFYVYGDVVGTVDGNTIIYISQAMGAYGSSIGEGNYQPKPQEWIYFEVDISGNLLNATYGHSDFGWASLDIEADTDGKIPKGAKVVEVNVAVNDSASAANNSYLALRVWSGVFGTECSPDGIANDKRKWTIGKVILDDGTGIEYYIEATGANTFDIPYFRYRGVQIN